MNRIQYSTKCRTGYGAALLATTMLVTAGSALAQQAVPAAAPAATNGGLEEIVVTATKRSEKLQSVPISIQAFGTEKLKQNQVSSFDDYAKLLPSVSFQSFGPGQTQLSFRGITSGGDGLHIGSLPTAGLYLDEIPVTTIAGAVDLHVYDLARVEALSGPQGTLYGASSLAGTLRLITNKPKQNKFEAGYDLTLDKFGNGNAGGTVEGFANIPVIKDKVAIRLVGFYEHDGGYISNLPKTRTYTLGDSDPTTNFTINNAALVKNNFNDVDTYGGRAALGVNLDESWTITPSITYQKQVSHGAFLYDPRVGDLKVHDFLPSRNADEFYQAGLTIEGKVGNFNLTYVGGYFARTVNNTIDYSYYTTAYDTLPGYTKFVDAAGNFLDPTQQIKSRDDYTKLNQEFRITTPADQPIRATVGLFYQRQTDFVQADYLVPALINADPTNTANAGGNTQIQLPGTADTFFLTRLNRIDKDYAAYGELSYDILSNLTLTGGIRGFLVRNSLIGFSGFESNIRTIDPTDPAGVRLLCLPIKFSDAPCTNVHAPIGASGPSRANQSGETHKINLSYKIDAGKLVYATYSTGYRPGGINRRPQFGAYRADTLINFELGAKTSFFDRKVRANIAVYYEKWKNIQYAISPPNSNGVFSTFNVGDAGVYGVETDLSWRVTPELTLSASGSYIDPKTTKSIIVVANSDPSKQLTVDNGTRLPVQPKYKINMTARYEVPLGTIDAYMQGVLATEGNTQPYLQNYPGVSNSKGFTTLDLSFGGKSGNSSFEVFLQNAFDVRGTLSLNTSCSPSFCSQYARNYPIKPRYMGIKFGQKF